MRIAAPAIQPMAGFKVLEVEGEVVDASAVAVAAATTVNTRSDKLLFGLGYTTDGLDGGKPSC